MEAIWDVKLVNKQKRMRWITFINISLKTKECRELAQSLVFLKEKDLEISKTLKQHTANSFINL
jgi:hypothetical protein